MASRWSVALLFVGLSIGCTDPSDANDAGPLRDGAVPPSDGGAPDAGPPCTETPSECARLAESAAAAELESLRDRPSELEEFLTELPKGGDLHNHLSGAIYAETYLEWARADGGYCIQNSDFALLTSCTTAGRVPVPDAEEALYDQVVRSWSMLDFVPSPSENGRDHFFATFGKFGSISGREHGRMVADVRRQAARENVLYLEPMLISNGTARSLGDDVWMGGTITEGDLPAFHAALLAASGFGAARQEILDDVEDSEAEADTLQGCAGPTPTAACGVTMRYQVYISRSGSLPGVFAQMVAAFEAAMLDDRVVAVNLVGPEDGSGAISSYAIEMIMLGYLDEYYADTSPLRISLHAGEITPAFVPGTFDFDVENHIRTAVEIAGADRIGHGIDILLESDPEGLFALLEEREVLVEICLASNDLILEVKGDPHPLDEYVAHGVPVALATDDPGVARSSLTLEHVRAVRDQGVDYAALKRMARASIEHSFLSGESLFVDTEFSAITAVCAPSAGQTLASEAPSTACSALLASSDRARVQHALELSFLAFEAGR